MMTFLFGVDLIATMLLLMAAALDDAVRRARPHRAKGIRIATGGLVSISLARAGVLREAVTRPVSERSEKQAA